MLKNRSQNGLRFSHFSLFLCSLGHICFSSRSKIIFKKKRHWFQCLKSNFNIFSFEISVCLTVTKSLNQREDLFSLFLWNAVIFLGRMLKKPWQRFYLNWAFFFFWTYILFQSVCIHSYKKVNTLIYVHRPISKEVNNNISLTFFFSDVSRKLWKKFFFFVCFF